MLSPPSPRRARVHDYDAPVPWYNSLSLSNSTRGEGFNSVDSDARSARAIHPPLPSSCADRTRRGGRARRLRETPQTRPDTPCLRYIPGRRRRRETALTPSLFHRSSPPRFIISDDAPRFGRRETAGPLLLLYLPRREISFSSHDSARIRRPRLARALSSNGANASNDRSYARAMVPAARKQSLVT